MTKKKGLLTVADKNRLAKSARQFIRDNPGESWDVQNISEAYALTSAEARELFSFMGIQSSTNTEQSK